MMTWKKNASDWSSYYYGVGLTMILNIGRKSTETHSWIFLRWNVLRNKTLFDGKDVAAVAWMRTCMSLLMTGCIDMLWFHCRAEHGASVHFCIPTPAARVQSRESPLHTCFCIPEVDPQPWHGKPRSSRLVQPVCVQQVP
jgi:hypothetical protein